MCVCACACVCYTGRERVCVNAKCFAHATIDTTANSTATHLPSTRMAIGTDMKTMRSMVQPTVCVCACVYVYSNVG